MAGIRLERKLLSKSYYKVENGKQFNQGVCLPSL